MELLVAMSLVLIAFVASAGALRGYWFTQALDSAADEAVTGLRRLQEATVSESHPVVYGLRLTEPDSGGGIAPSEKWDAVRFDPRVTSGPQCTYTERNDFGGSLGASVEVASVTVGDPAEAAVCRDDLGLGSSDKFFFFYPRGNATTGSFVLRQPMLDKTRTISITGVTGRVTRS
jgi:hypothetical protein